LEEIALRTGHSLNETYKTWLNVQSCLNQSGVKTEAGIWLPVASDDILHVISKDPRLLQQVSWREFERIMADLLERLGFQIELQQGTKDGGIDILALRGGPLGDHRYLIQAKRWANKVGVEPVRQLLFLQGHYRATKGCLATTSTFTRGARELAAEYRWQLDLKDLRGIQDWVAEAIHSSA
jgi:restriction system protein